MRDSDDGPDARRDGPDPVRAGWPRPEQGAAFLPGPTFAAPYHSAGDAGSGRYYGRNDNPTWERYESALAELEGAPTIVVGSGMAAVAAVMFTVLRPGDVLVLPRACFFVTRVLAREQLAPRGIVVREVDGAAGELLEAVGDAQLVWLETPSNPTLDLCDIAEVVSCARASGALVAVDNTTATPWLQHPLDLGADVSVSSDTKALTGHSDLLLGHVATRDDRLLDRLRSWRSQAGSIAGPFEVWLAHRSLGTLEVRLARQSRGRPST